MKYWALLAILLTMIPAATAVVRKKPIPSKNAAKKKTVIKKSLTTKRTHPKALQTRQSLDRKGTTSRRTTMATAKQPPRQQAPSNDRYKEIQEALAAKGYLTTTPNGEWDQNSQDAMRRFQADQNINSTGKLTSKSLIALGLGSPKP